jgi:inositol-phosphate phosphatase / L-galactose 1-phosphate phosphatase / histidinol-phosphatase
MTINQELINFSNYLADISATLAKKYFRSQITGEFEKEDNSPVTKADREIEKLIRDEIEKKYPNHGIIGEEFGNKNINADYVWILDPIDGTSSFIIGRPLFGTLISLTFKGKAILGIVNQPINNERWVGIADQGSFFNGAKIQTRKCSELSNAVMCASSSFYFKDEDSKMFEELCTLTKYQKLGGVIYGGDCYSYASLASGFIDIVMDPGLQVYDYAALQPIISEAGGVVTDWQGNDPNLQSNVKLIACGDKKLHEKIIKLITKISGN